MKAVTINRQPSLSGDLAPGVAKELATLRDEVAYALESPERAMVIDALPTAEEAYSGIIFIVKLTNGPEQAWLCLRNSNGTYGWQACASGI